MHVRKPLTTFLLAAALAAGAARAQASQGTPLEWSALRWQTFGAVRAEEHLGRPALRFGSGDARLEGEPFENGTIEFDVAATGTRSFFGVTFRRTATQYEHVYLRPHQSGRFDAMQYTPDFHDLSGWQIYPEYNGSVEIPRDTWLHVRLVVAGSKLQVWVGDSAKPQLDVDGLRCGPGAGAIVLTSFVPGAAEGDFPNAFSNVTITRSDKAVNWTPPGAPPADAGFVREWSVSAPVPGPERPIEALPPGWAGGHADLRFSRIAADERGRVNLARLAGIPEGEPRGMVYARVRVRSASEQVKRLDYGFSDQLSVFVNGRLVYTGNNTYLSRSQRYLGVMTIDNDALHVPLRKGDNELVFAVIEAFGGWGLTARFPDPSGLTVGPY